jgi:peptidoglycan/LPS O-acetylase OafA/YrhL
MIGLLFAYFIDKWETERKTDEFETKLEKMKLYLVKSLIVSFLVPISIFILSSFIELYIITVLIESITKVLCSFVFGLFIVQLHFGKLDLINNFLSSKFWMPLSKISFCLYLVGSVIQFNLIKENYSADNFNVIRLVDD